MSVTTGKISQDATVSAKPSIFVPGIDMSLPVGAQNVKLAVSSIVTPIVTPEQFGAVADGAAADAGAFTAAMNQNIDGVVYAAAGNTYKLGSAVTTGTSLLVASGAGFVDPANLVQWDPTAWACSPYVMSYNMTKGGSAVLGSANQFAQVISTTVPVTSAAANYEKAGLYVVGVTVDPSTYGGGGVTRDYSGIEVHSVSNVAGTGLGRVWGYHTTVEIAPGTDGFCAGMEIEVQNNGSNSGIIGDVQTGKVGINIISTGSTAATTALVVRPSGNTFNGGLELLPGSLTDGGFALLVPNRCPIGAFDTGLGQRTLIFLDQTNTVILGDAGLTNIIAQSTLLPATNGTLQLGASANRWASVWAANGTIQTSDPDLKTDIAPLPPALPIVAKINPVTFRWKDGGSGDPGKRTHWGFLAPDILAATPEGMDWAAYVKAEDDTQHIRPDELIPVLWRAVQELQAELDAIKARLP